MKPIKPKVAAPELGSRSMSVAQIEQRLARAEEEAELLPELDRKAHEAWVQPHKRVPGETPSGTQSALLSLIGILRAELAEARYAEALAAHPGPCDCAVLVALGQIWRQPSSSALRELDGDRMYWDHFVCDLCGAGWTKSTDCDDVGLHSDWTPTAPSALHTGENRGDQKHSK